MKADWKSAEDRQQLMNLIAATHSAKQRDRYRAVLIACQGLGDKSEVDRETIALTLGRSRQFVDQWVGRYRKGGIGGLSAKPQPGAKRQLTAEQEQEFCAMLDAGPSPEEGLAAYNGPILREKIAERFGKLYSLSGTYKLLHRLGYNDLMPRPRHPQTDPAALEAFKKELPERLAQLRDEHPDKRIVTYYQDEARFGQHGTLTRVWAKVGSRPPAIRQTQYDYLYVFSAVCPETGQASGLITPQVNTDTMNAFLEQFSGELASDIHAAVVLDRAGWHVAGALRVPKNVTLVLLPPKSPELNPTENLWHYLRSHHWSNRLYPSWNDLKQAAIEAWRKVCLMPERIRSICADTALHAN